RRPPAARGVTRGVLAGEPPVLEQAAGLKSRQRAVGGGGGMLLLDETAPQGGARAGTRGEQAHRGAARGVEVGERLEPGDERVRERVPDGERQPRERLRREGSKPPPIQFGQPGA